MKIEKGREIHEKRSYIKGIDYLPKYQVVQIDFDKNDFLRIDKRL